MVVPRGVPLCVRSVPGTAGSQVARGPRRVRIAPRDGGLGLAEAAVAVNYNVLMIFGERL